MARSTYRETTAVRALRGLVAFAESDGDKSVGELIPLVAAGRDFVRNATWQAVLRLNRQQLQDLAADLHTFFRAVLKPGSDYEDATRFTVTGVPVFTTEKRSRGDKPLAAVNGQPRDVLRYAASTTLQLVGIDRLRLCPAPDCRHVFVKIGRREYCSARCQRRVFVSTYDPFRAIERPARHRQASPSRKDQQHGREKKTRTR